MKLQLNTWKVYTIGLLLLAALIVFPFLKNFPFSNIQLLKNNDNEFSTTLWRTISYALISAVILTSFGFIGALMLRKITPFSWLGKNLGILILPIMLGNISIAFICKLLVGGLCFFF